jgi:hypothetical protein
MTTPPPGLNLWRRSDLRLALTAGLTLGFTTLTTVPYGYYAALAVLSVMASSFGSSLELSRQRVLGTLLGALVVVLFYEGLAGIPLPLALAMALGLQRLLGGLLRLQVGYKVGGMVIVMGWLVHNAQFSSWLPLRLGWTVFGIAVSLLSLRLLWPASAVAACWSSWAALFDRLGRDLSRVVAGSAQAPAMALPEVVVEVGELRRLLIAQRAALPAIRDELGGARASHPLIALLACFEDNSSRLIGLLQVFQRQQPYGSHADLQAFSQGEAALLTAIAQRLQQWHQCLRQASTRVGRPIPPPPPGRFAAPSAWCEAEQRLQQPLVSPASLERLQQVAVRQQLCRQMLAALQQAEIQWHAVGG